MASEYDALLTAPAPSEYDALLSPPSEYDALLEDHKRVAPPQVQDIMDQSAAQQAIERNANGGTEANEFIRGLDLATIPQEVLLNLAGPLPQTYQDFKSTYEWMRGKKTLTEAFPETQTLVGIEKKPLEERIKTAADILMQVAFLKEGGQGVFGRGGSAKERAKEQPPVPPPPPDLQGAETRMPVESAEIPQPSTLNPQPAIDSIAVAAANAEGLKAIQAEQQTSNVERSTSNVQREVPPEEQAQIDYQNELLAAANEFQGSQGYELKDAIIKAGGLPSRASEFRTAEIHDLEQTILDPQRTERIAPNQMFRANAPSLDEMATRLRDQGFDIAGPNELYDLLDQRFRTGKLIFGQPELAQVFKPKGKTAAEYAREQGVGPVTDISKLYGPGDRRVQTYEDVLGNERSGPAYAPPDISAKFAELRDINKEYAKRPTKRTLNELAPKADRIRGELARAGYDSEFIANVETGRAGPPLPERPPTLHRGEKQGDLLSTQTEPFALVGEKGIDYAAQQRASEAAAVAKQEADALAAQQQGNLFKPAQQQTLPRQITPAPALPVNAGIPVAEADIRTYLSKSLDIPVRAGMKIAGGMRGAEGVFRVKPETIRTKLRNDIPTIAHEVGHYLHHLLFTDASGKPSTFAGNFDTELMPLGRVTSGPRYSPHQVRMEGVAEYMSKFLTDPPAAIASAPTFHTFFETELRTKYPETWEIVSTARDQVQRFLSQPGWEKARARIVFDPKQPRATFRQWLSGKYTDWFNELAPIDRTMNKLVEFGLDPAMARQVSNRAINYKGGWRGKADFDLEFDQTNINGQRVGPGLKTILKGLAPKELGDFSTYIALKRAIEKVSQGIKTGFEPELSEPATRKKLVDLAPRYEQKRQQLIQYSDHALQLLEESGYFTGAQMAKMRALNKDYVPFYRVYEGVTGTSTGPKGAAGGFVNTSSGVLRMKGSDRQIVDPLESIIKNTYMMRDLAERNRVGKEFVAAVEQTQGGGRVGESVIKPMKPVQVTPIEVADKVMDLLGIKVDKQFSAQELAMTIWRASEGVNAKEGIFRIWEGGKEKLFQVDDVDLLRALSLSDTVDANAIKLLPGFKPLSQITKFLRVGATLTPEFIVRNPFRDQITAAVFSRYGFLPFFDGFRGLFHAIRKDNLYQDWVKSGGRYSGLYDVEGGNLRATLERTIHDPNALQQALDLINPRNVLRNLASASSLMEEATRVSEFRRAMRSGADPIEAANASKDVTLNFSRSGIKGKILNQVVAFFNASLQDVDKLIRAHKEAPLRTATKAFIYISVPSILTWMMGKDDPEIQNLPEWRKSFFWNLNLHGHVFSFPKPFLLGALYGTSVEKALDYAHGRDPNAVWKALSAIYQNTFIRSDLITATNAFKPLVENITNYSFFTGRPLVGEGLKGLSPALQSNPTTSETAKFVGGKLGVAPIFVDNMVRGYFGGLGKYGTDAIDWFMLKAQGDDAPKPPAKDVSQLPVIRGFMRQPYESSEYVQRFYKALDRAETRLNDFRAYGNRLDTPGMKDFITRNKNELVWYNAGTGDEEATVMTQLRRLRDDMSDINKAIVMVQQSRAISPEEKARRIIQLGTARDKIAESAFKTYVHPSDRAKVF